MIGGDETYEARCVKCYELPDIQHEKRKKGLKLLQFETIK
jgi:thymidine kinase